MKMNWASTSCNHHGTRWCMVKQPSRIPFVTLVLRQVRSRWYHSISVPDGKKILPWYRTRGLYFYAYFVVHLLPIFAILVAADGRLCLRQPNHQPLKQRTNNYQPSIRSKPGANPRTRYRWWQVGYNSLGVEILVFSPSCSWNQNSKQTQRCVLSVRLSKRAWIRKGTVAALSLSNKALKMSKTSLSEMPSRPSSVPWPNDLGRRVKIAGHVRRFFHHGSKRSANGWWPLCRLRRWKICACGRWRTWNVPSWNNARSYPTCQPWKPHFDTLKAGELRIS